MDKIKILVVPGDRTGVGYFRSIKPHLALNEKYSNEFTIDIDYEPRLDDNEWLKQYDIIHYHRTLGPYEKHKEIVDKLDEMGILTIMDIDDYWSPGPHHPAYAIIKQNNLDKLILQNVINAKYITTTTNIFADVIKKYNKNVFVIPNAIDPNEEQYKPNPVKSDRIRIGWLGGSSHLEDLKLLNGVSLKLKKDGLLDKIQFVLCGFDLRGSIKKIDKRTGQVYERPIKPKESVWYQYEKIFTGDYSIVSDKYKKYLLEFNSDEYNDVDNEPYRRVWTKHITKYATSYNYIDITLAPLYENIFNKVKSQLKVIEAGFHKKALIAQDFGPYKIDLINLFDKPQKSSNDIELNPNGNALLIPSSKNHKLWYKYIKKLILEPELIDLLSERLYNTVCDKYDIHTITDNRRKLYLELLEKNRKKLIKV